MPVLQIRQGLHDIIKVADDKMVAAVYVFLQSLLQNDNFHRWFYGLWPTADQGGINCPCSGISCDGQGRQG